MVDTPLVGGQNGIDLIFLKVLHGFAEVIPLLMMSSCMSSVTLRMVSVMGSNPSQSVLDHSFSPPPRDSSTIRFSIKEGRSSTSESPGAGASRYLVVAAYMHPGLSSSKLRLHAEKTCAKCALTVGLHSAGILGIEDPCTWMSCSLLWIRCLK